MSLWKKLGVQISLVLVMVIASIGMVWSGHGGAEVGRGGLFGIAASALVFLGAAAGLVVFTAHLGLTTMRTAAALCRVLVGVQMSGDLSLRVRASGNDEMAEAARAVNALLDDIEPVLKEIKSVMLAVSDGDLTARVRTLANSGLVNDVRASVNDSLDILAETLRAIARDVEQVSSATGEATAAIEPTRSDSTCR